MFHPGPIADTNYKTKATREDREYFEFTENHTCAKTDVAVYLSKICVPMFPWNWIGSTKAFATSIFHPVPIANRDYKMREEYAFKFMLLFLPFRNHSDLLQDGSYQLKLVTEERNVKLSAEMLDALCLQTPKDGGHVFLRVLQSDRVH